MSSPLRLAIVASHPVQYYAPWFRKLAAHPSVALRVFYLWGGGNDAAHDPGFGRTIRWDLDLLSGYDHEFVPNTARAPGTWHYNGLVNPELSSRLRHFRPQAVLAFGYGWRALTSLALTWRDCPLLLRGDTHSIGREVLPAWRRPLQRWLTARLLKCYWGFASVGAAHTRFLTTHGVPPHRIFFVPHCVDNDRWAAATESAAPATTAFRASLGIPPNHRVILFAGKFETKKRPDLLLEAFRRADLPRTALLMVGDGPLRDSLQAQARELRSVYWAPFQNQLEMPRTYAAADLMVLPSQGREESWGLAVNEAMASGLPCVVSTHVGCRENLIAEGETGWSFEAGNVAALTTTLQSALATLTNPAARAQMQSAISARIAAYSYDAARDALLHALNAVIRPSGSTQSTA